MPKKAYTLRPEYEGTLVGGSVITGVDCGSMDIMEEIAKNGKIVTDDTVFQGILENYYGISGGQPVRIFEAAMIDPETGVLTHVPLIGDADHQGASTAPPRPDLLAAVPEGASGADVSPDTVQTADAGGSDTAPADPPATEDPGAAGAQHEEGSGYDGLMVAELQDIIAERGLAAPSSATKAVLISILEDHDNEEAQS